MRLDGKVAVVTGASSGIGRAIAIGCAREGADLAITYRGNAGRGRGDGRGDPAAGTPRGGPAGRHQPGRGRRGARRGSPAALRPRRRMDQQRGRRHPDRRRRAPVGPAEARPRAGRRSARDDHHILGGGGADAGTGGRHRQHVVGSRGLRHGGREPRPLFGGQGRDHELQQVVCPAGRAAGPGEHPGARLHRDRLRRAGRRALAAGRRSANAPGRWGTPEDVAGAAIFLASDESKFLTGQMIMVNGGVVM